ncbi:uncharacterized protein LOC134257739 isoform X4 [Saccostrea cucullata]|uniref:uncharacterized protein LOC134257739 isoform X4 n=1 Tax=Saccostrea cuccullata TaxID=36930 RepID=UPI002ED0F844
MFVRVSYLCLVGLVLFVALETVLSEEENIKNPDTSALFKRRLSMRGRRVAFTAYLGNQKIKSNKQVIRYSRIALNIGRAYRRGIFRAPSNGVYVFFFTSMPQRGKGDAL